MNDAIPSKVAVPTADTTRKPLGEVIAINESLVKDHLDQVVRQTVEETLNAMLSAEADAWPRKGTGKNSLTRSTRGAPARAAKRSATPIGPIPT
jgi:hypothetical protein